MSILWRVPAGLHIACVATQQARFVVHPAVRLSAFSPPAHAESVCNAWLPQMGGAAMRCCAQSCIFPGLLTRLL